MLPTHSTLSKSLKNKDHLAETLLRQTEIWDTAVACGSEHSNNVRNNHPEEDKNY